MMGMLGLEGTIRRTIGVANDGAKTTTTKKQKKKNGESKEGEGGGGKGRPYGIDVVLGSQWGDEGKGKLVDILSQVSFGHIATIL